MDLKALRTGFEKVGFKPALMRDMVKGASAEGNTDVEAGLEHYMSSEQQVKTWQALLDSTDAFGQGLLVGIAKGLVPLDKEMRTFLQTIPGAKPRISTIRSLTAHLKSSGLLTRIGAGISIDASLFVAYLARRTKQSS